MGRKANVGLIKKKRIWHIDKFICGRRVCKSTRCTELVSAERFLAKLILEMEHAVIYGVRTKRTFKEASDKYLIVKAHKKSIDDDRSIIKNLLPWIGSISIDQIYMEVLGPWLASRVKDKVKTNTINHGLKVVRQILNCAVEWRDEYGLSWLEIAPKITLRPVKDTAKPYPINWQEQDDLLAQLAPHLQDILLFSVNTGCRDQEVCQLRWEWEIPIDDINSSVFWIPEEFTKNGEDKIVVLNSEAKSVIERCRGKNATHVFSYRGKPITRIMSSGWKRARKAAGLSHVKVHDLRHTFGRRLRSADVSIEDREDLLGHKSTRMTTHYSAVELDNLIAATEKLCGEDGKKPSLLILRRRHLEG
tara:strand:- start:788 stop:1870 length:1083 start_codon:yes stop_codon:yes gene_type:complete